MDHQSVEPRHIPARMNGSPFTTVRREPVFYGELLVDILFREDQTASYHPGGAPANAAATAAGMGARPYLVGTVGDDRLGHWLEYCVCASGIRTEALRVTEGFATTVAVALPHGSTTEKFLLYRGADVKISNEQVSVIDVDTIGVCVYGSLSLTGEPVMASSLAHLKRLAHDAGGLLMCDLNYRESMWRTPGDFVRATRREAARADIVKANAVEAALLVGESKSPIDMAEDILRLGPKLVVVTAGTDGLVALTSTSRVELEVDRRVLGSDLVGTGDAVTGSLAKSISHFGFEAVTATTADLEVVLRESMTFAAAAASAEGANWPHVVPFAR